jgi:dienelactone hydrolase
MRLCRALAAVALLAAAAPMRAQAPVERIAVDLREEIQRLEVRAKDLFGKEESRNIALTVFRPPGDGPFPLAVISHGRSVADQRARQGRQRFEIVARYLVDKGFAVIVPTRIGYGDTHGSGFDPEEGGGCQQLRPEPMSIAASDQVIAAVEHARTLPYVDASRWIALGQSVGGLTTVALAWRNPPGLAAAINFSGGAGGNPATQANEPCAPQRIEQLWRSKAGESKLPMLWIYWQHDRYWGPEYPKRWAKAWADGGGKLDFHHLPPWNDDAKGDGHGGISANLDAWVPLVEAHLARAGFTRSGLVARPAPSGFARIDETDKLPLNAERKTTFWAPFTAAPKPRAFAIGPGGVAGWASGDWALGRALGNCQWRSGQRCKLYAVDDDVVWAP